jgi:O-antigen ligase
LTPTRSRLAGVLALVAAAAVFFPLGASGLLALAWLGLALGLLLAGRLQVMKEGTPWLLAWVAWLALSALWSPAPWSPIVRQASHAVALLAVPVVAASLQPAQARWALRAFVVAALVLCGAWLVHAWRPFEDKQLLSTMVYYSGNKSIANAMLMALAALLAAQMALQQRNRGSAVWAGVAMLLAAVLCWKSAARTAHVVLAIGVMALAWWHLRSMRLRLLASFAAIALAAAFVLGGWSGLSARASAGQLALSNAQRLSVYQETLIMISERPLSGHGLASWAWSWPQRTTRPELREFNTAHNVPLELAAEGGAPAVLLLAPAILAWAGFAARARLAGAGGPAALVLLTWGVASLFNAALRDPVFATPMIVLLSIGLAAARSDDSG